MATTAHHRLPSTSKKAQISHHHRSKSSVSLGKKSLSHGKLNRLRDDRDKRRPQEDDEEAMAAYLPNYW